jgi:transcriptional regulator with XRE-family HTH domain
LEALRHIRTMRGMNQVDLARASGVAQNTISEIELGKREARPGTLKKLADALGVGIADLLGNTPPKAQAPLPLEPVPQERGYTFLARQLEDWRHLFEQAAEQWNREAQSGNLFGSVDSASAYSIATSIQVVQFFAVIDERLLPTVDEMLPEDLAHAERRKLLESRDKLGEATEAVHAAALETVPEPLADEREFSEAELAIIDEAAKDFEALPELEQRRQMREAWEVVDRIIHEQDERADNHGSAAG